MEDDDSDSINLSWFPAREVLTAVIKLLAPQRPNPAEELNVQILAHKLAILKNGTLNVTYVPFPDCVPSERHDLAVLGKRGSGKTALACAWAQVLSAQLELPLCYALPDHLAPIAQELHGHHITPAQIPQLKDAIVVVDEASIQAPSRRSKSPLADTLTLARHRNLSLIWTGVHFAALNRDILRVLELCAFRQLEPLSTAFDRPEAAEVLATALSLQGSTNDPTETTLYGGGRWFRTNTPLPHGWTQEISTLWR